MENTRGRPVWFLVGLACFFLILFGIRGTASILCPILLAAVITITVLPVPSNLAKRGLPGWLSLVLTILLVILILGLVIVTVFFSVTKLSATLPTYLDSGLQRAREDLSVTRGSGLDIQIEQAGSSLGPVAQGMLAATLDLLVQFGLALVIFIFMIAAALALPAPSRLGLDPATPGVKRVSALTGDVRQYMTILTGINLLVALGNTILLLFLGVDYALLWGLLSWFMGYIPTIGFWIAMIPPLLLAYAEFGLETALVVFLAYVVINGGIQNFVQPKIMGDRLKISPLVVFIGLFVWGFLLGGIGAILAVPMTLLVLIALENFEGTRMLAVLMRYTGEAKKAERQEALSQARGQWRRLAGRAQPGGEPEDTSRESEDTAHEQDNPAE